MIASLIGVVLGFLILAWKMDAIVRWMIAYDERRARIKATPRHANLCGLRLGSFCDYGVNDKPIEVTTFYDDVLPLTEAWTERDHQELREIYCNCGSKSYQRKDHHEDCPMQLPTDILLEIEAL